MSERIKELANKAGIQLDYFGLGSCADGGNPDIEKFAELIVRECAEVADNADATRQKWEGIGKYVREHFGVE